MTKAKHSGTAVRMACFLALACGGRGHAIAQAAVPPSPGAQVAASLPGDRQKAVLSDTDHLVQLAQQLKTNVEKTRRDELSMQVIREADEIEKLARSVKARIH